MIDARARLLATCSGATLCVASALARPAHAAETWVPWAATPAVAAPSLGADTDHDEVRLRLGVGTFGRFEVPIGEAAERTLATQTLGVRFWFRRAVGVDASLGLHASLGGRSRADASALAIGGRVALPIALLVTRHLTLFLAPTLSYGQGGLTEPGRPQPNAVTGLEWTPPDTRLRGLRAAAGARLGGELHLGFVGASHLSIAASVGLDVDYVYGRTTAPPSPTSRDASPRAATSASSAWRMHTTFGDEAWSSLLGDVALVGYF